MTKTTRAPARLTLEQYIDGIRHDDRAVLARAITLIESANKNDRALARALLENILPHAGGAVRVGITGVPGVGKSTSIETLGLNLTDQGHKVAVLAIDPSSVRSGGSILGDKTRMSKLAVNPKAYIRPSPTTGTLGGVGTNTRDAIVLCEAAGFDVVLVETVGIGQSEMMVADMVDFFLVLMLPGAGDELQGIKKGLFELADLIAINKADGDNKGRALQAAANYQAALNILTPANPDWRVPVVTYSGLLNEGVDAIWNLIEQHRAIARKSGAFEKHRRAQQLTAMHRLLDDRVIETLRARPDVKDRLSELETKLGAGDLTPGMAVDDILKLAGLQPSG